MKFLLISSIPELSGAVLQKIAEVLTIQANQHLYQYYGKTASFEVGNEKKEGFVPVEIQRSIENEGAGDGYQQNGYHWADASGPYVKVRYTSDIDQLSLTISHECLETIINPYIEKFGNPVDLSLQNSRGEPFFEICDICQTKQFGYRINGILVSNFVTPNYYDKNFTKGVRYDFLGKVETPGQILEGGYMSWRISDSEYLQAFRIKGVLFWKKLTGDKVINLTANSTPFPVALFIMGLAIVGGILYLIFRKKN